MLTRNTIPQRTRRLGLLGATALGLALVAAPALAKPNAGHDTAAADSGPYGAREQVQVIVPRGRPPITIKQHWTGRMSFIGAPIENVSMSEGVPYGDLNLSKPEGAHMLRQRIRDTARHLCERMDVAYPLKTSQSPPCYRGALASAMGQANKLIRNARAYND